MLNESPICYISGIKPTGNLHMGNYIGCIKPILKILKSKKNINVYFFIADYHSLANNAINPKSLKSNIKELMDMFYICIHKISDQIKNNNNNVYMYRQSKISSIFELNWILSNFTQKGLLNRCHAYKVITDNNITKNKDTDKGVYMGLYTYPVLMASDILILNPNYVVVGKDQYQHINITNDISKKFNYDYKTSYFKIVEPYQNNVETLIGSDGKKMSKSYGNTLNILFSEKEIRKYVSVIKTNSKMENEPKFPSESYISNLMKSISTQKEYETFVKLMESGMSWKNLKRIVYEKIVDEFSYIKREYSVISKSNTAEMFFEKNETFINDSATVNLKKIKRIIGI